MKASAFLLGKHSLSLEHPYIMDVIELTLSSVYVSPPISTNEIKEMLRLARLQ